MTSRFFLISHVLAARQRKYVFKPVRTLVSKVLALGSLRTIVHNERAYVRMLSNKTLFVLQTQCMADRLNFLRPELPSPVDPATV